MTTRTDRFPLALAGSSFPWGRLAFAFLLQKVENYFIVPRVMSAKVSISPLAVFIAFLVVLGLIVLSLSVLERRVRGVEVVT